MRPSPRSGGAGAGARVRVEHLGVGSTSDQPTTDYSGYTPPVNASAAQVAVSAAMSVIGTTYVWGSADPNVGFDCSGLTSWAWAQAGVIPHSSAAQYSSLPHVALGASSRAT